MILGICLESEAFQAALVSGSKTAPKLEQRYICKNPETANLARSASWYENRFFQLIDNHSPTEIVAKIHYDVKNQAGLINHGFPLGILAKCCHVRGLELTLVTVQKLKGVTLFSLPKGTSTYEWIDQYKDTQPYWKNSGRIATLAALSKL